MATLTKRISLILTDLGVYVYHLNNLQLALILETF